VTANFYTKAEVDAKIPTGVVVSGAVLRGDSASDVRVLPGTLCWAGSGQTTAGSPDTVVSDPNTMVWGNLTLPLGVTLNGMTVKWYDMSPADAQIKLWKLSDSSPTGLDIAAVATSGAAGYGESSVTFNETVESGEVFLVSYILPAVTGSIPQTVTDPVNEAGLCGLEITYDAG
jgi:hypothetical protein